MEANDPLRASEARLSQMDFSEPVCSCKSTGHYTNSQGQEFTITVLGFDADQMRDYTKNARVEMEVVPLDQARPEEQDPDLKDKERQRKEPDDEVEMREPSSGGDLDITIEIVNTAGVEPPYVFYVTIDPSIAGGVVHRYTIASSARGADVKVSATSNGVGAALYRGSEVVRRKKADTYPPNPPNVNAYLSYGSEASSSYSLTVTGINANNSYTYSASAR